MTTRPSILLACVALSAAVAISRPAAAQCAADVFPDVPDGVVDVFDLLVLLSCHAPPCDGDINGDGTLDSVDLALLLFHWGPCEEDLVVGSASANLVVENITDPTTAALGFREFDVFVQFGGPDPVLLSVLNAQINCDCQNGFQHGAGTGWLPFSEVFWEALGLTYDSYVTIGPRFADGNLTDLDPSFTSGADTVSGGWFQASPDFLQGRAGEYPGNRVRVATLTTESNTSIDGTLDVAFWDEAGDPFFGSGVLDISAGLGDIDADGTVGISDFLALLAAWGPCPSATDPCPADVDGSGAVGIEDFLIVLAAWG